MMINQVDLIDFHNDEDLFREALEFTAADSGFPARLVEKDYFCTLLLQYLINHETQLIFKGGTSLAKIHSDFYRLSEDLDFSIPMPTSSSRNQRRGSVRGLKTAAELIDEALSVFDTVSPIVGANQSTQYNAVVAYPSALAEDRETIKIEVGLREPLVREALKTGARTLILDPASETPLVPPLDVTSLSWEEAMAEKARAALTRKQAAIRDFYDIHFAVTKRDLNLKEPEFLELVTEKLKVPGNDTIDVSEQRLDDLRAQVETELRPVLRSADFASFDLDGTFSVVSELAGEIE